MNKATFMAAVPQAKWSGSVIGVVAGDAAAEYRVRHVRIGANDWQHKEAATPEHEGLARGRCGCLLEPVSGALLMDINLCGDRQRLNYTMV
jgi:hypothetical protein